MGLGKFAIRRISARPGITSDPVGRTSPAEPGASPLTAAASTPSAATGTTVPQVDDQERPGRDLGGWVDRLVAVVAFAVAVLAIWQVFRPLPQGSQYYLIVFLAGTLPLVYLVYRSGLGRLDPDDRPGALDWVLAAITLVVCLYPVLPVRIGSGGGGYDAFLDRQGLLEPIDVAMGALLLVLILEACRRTTGWALPVVCGLFLAYGYYGGLLPQDWAIAHAGLDFDQIVDALYNSGSGFFGTPLDVAATYIVLFTIYGAVLELSGAARFFVDLSVAAFRRSRSAAGRTDGGVGISARHGVGLGYGDRRQRRRGHLADHAPGRLHARTGRRRAGRGRRRGAAVPADARGRRVHRRRVPRGLLPDGARLGDHPDRPVLPGHPARRRDRRPPVRRAPGESRRPVRRGSCWPASDITSRR